MPNVFRKYDADLDAAIDAQSEGRPTPARAKPAAPAQAPTVDFFKSRPVDPEVAAARNAARLRLLRDRQ